MSKFQWKAFNNSILISEQKNMTIYSVPSLSYLSYCPWAPYMAYVSSTLKLIFCVLNIIDTNVTFKKIIKILYNSLLHLEKSWTNNWLSYCIKGSNILLFPQWGRTMFNVQARCTYWCSNCFLEHYFINHIFIPSCWLSCDRVFFIRKAVSLAAPLAYQHSLIILAITRNACK